jgi:hypothetical protein
MTQDEIIEMAESCGWDKGNTWDDCMRCSPFNIEDFAKLVAQHEREACARVVEAWSDWHGGTEILSKAIRARAKE